MPDHTPASQPPNAAPPGDLALARAHWVRADTILWPLPAAGDWRFRLHYDPECGLRLEDNAVAGGAVVELALDLGGPGDALRARFPHLAGCTAVRVPSVDRGGLRTLLKSQLAVSAWDGAGRRVAVTALQIPGVLDDLFAYDGPLGVIFDAGAPELRVWAPTARRVSLLLYDGPRSPEPLATVAMEQDPASGVWLARGTAGWLGCYYLYEVEAFVRATSRIERNRVTDPYSASLSANGRRSQIVDLADPALQPPGWSELAKPPLDAPADAVVYELHVRDFSIRDERVRPECRGKFLAFTEPDSHGMRHLRRLAAAGLTHVQLLPVFDFATVDEDPTARVEPDLAALARLPGHSPEQQAAVAAVKERDGYNWGYDPLHYGAPEGSYATEPDGPARIREFRAMVQGLAEAGLRVVMDVVYNHTYAGGQSATSVLDRIVPGYYHRLNADGIVENSTCCANTASEHAMMEKLMVDTLVRWATAYKVDGFRFDLMGHHMVANLEHARAALRALTPEHDGVDGATIILYGEGWDFGEVAGSARGRNASQANMAGTGIGTFNDRLRDAARGGGAFSGLQEQGFATGLYHTPNGTPQGSVAEQRARLLEFADRIRVSLAGNLRDLRLVDWQGHAVTGAEIRYGGGAGYTLRPEENVLYVAAHDNETLFDAIQLKAPVEASLADRVRMNNLALSLVLLGQGLPFLHAGDELLRSKSLDRNSYNSGDWFNALDYSATRTGWAAGLPPAGENEPHWPVMAALLANPALAPRREHVLRARAHVEELLRIRRSSRLFRLRTAEAIHAGVAFPQAGPSPAPGVIVLRLSGDDPDGGYSCIVVIVNASTHGHGFVDPELRGRPFALHPVLAASADPVVRRATHYTRHATFWVPARTTAVFVSPPPPAAARAGGLRGRLRQLAALARHGLAALPRRK